MPNPSGCEKLTLSPVRKPQEGTRGQEPGQGLDATPTKPGDMTPAARIATGVFLCKTGIPAIPRPENPAGSLARARPFHRNSFLTAHWRPYPIGPAAWCALRDSGPLQCGEPPHSRQLQNILTLNQVKLGGKPSAVVRTCTRRRSGTPRIRLRAGRPPWTRTACQPSPATSPRPQG